MRLFVSAPVYFFYVCFILLVVQSCTARLFVFASPPRYGYSKTYAAAYDVLCYQWNLRTFEGFSLCSEEEPSC